MPSDLRIEIERKHRKVLLNSAILVILGIVLSGPPLVFLVEYLHPQPRWIDVETFIQNFHSLQTLPYWFGFLLLAGNMLFIISVGRLEPIRDRIQSQLSFVCLAIYSAMVSINYGIQTTSIPALVSASGAWLEAFSMVNPASICWTIEMFAYAFLGVAYWLVAGAFQGKGLFRMIRYLMIFNGIASVLGILLPVLNPAALLEQEGIIGYCLWNLLIVLIMALIIVAARDDSNFRIRDPQH